MAHNWGVTCCTPAGQILGQEQKSMQVRHSKLVPQQRSGSSAYQLTEARSGGIDTTHIDNPRVKLYHRIFNMLIMVASFSRRSHPIHAIYPHVWGIR